MRREETAVLWLKKKHILIRKMEMRMRRGIGGREEEYQYLKYEEFLEDFTWECSKFISTHQPK